MVRPMTGSAHADGWFGLDDFKHLHANCVCNVKVSKNAPTNGQWPEISTSTRF